MIARLAGIAVLLAAVCATSVGGARAQSPPPGSGPGGYYIALGDSLAYGVTAPGVQPDPLCASPTAPGYVCIIYGYLRQINPSLQLENLAAPDVDSCVLDNGFGSGSSCLHAPGVTPLSSPLVAALGFIKTHPGQVGIVTLDVGGADLIPLLPAALADPVGAAARLPGVVQAFQANLDTALSQLHAALGDAAARRIILITQYNPLGGIASPPLPAGLPDIARGAINTLNAIMKAEAMKYGVAVADVAGAFDAHPGGAALLTFVPTSLASGDPSQIDIYPTQDGYRLYGETVLKTSSYRVSRKVKARVAHRSIRRRSRDRVTGSTVAGAAVTVRVSRPHAHSSTSFLFADNNGAFVLPFSAGRHSGKGIVRVCATDEVSNRISCTKATFTVR